MPGALNPDCPVRWGILGAGGIARTVGTDIAASPESIVQAVAAREPARARALAADLGASHGYGDYARLLADPAVDVVYVATTHGQHYPQVHAALTAGKPVLVEKSFTVNAGQAAALVELARARDLFCMEAMWTRCLPAVQCAVQAAASEIGPVIGLRTDLCRAITYDPAHRLWDRTTGGGVLLDMGVYLAHLAWLVLGEPATVQTTGRLAATGVDATAAMLWGYRDGRYAQLTASFDGVTDGPHTVISGRDGWVALHGRTHEPPRVVVHRGDQERVITATRSGNGYGAQVTEVERALRAGDLESPWVPLADTIGVLRVLDAARATLGVDYGELEAG